MKTKFFNYAAVVALGSALCLTSVSLAQEPNKATPPKASPAAKAPVKTASVAKPEAAKKPSSKPGAAESDDVVQKKLEDFASNTVTTLDKHRLDGESRKKVQMIDGKYVASYCSIDRKSVQTSFKKPEFSNAITYVGYMKYHEVSYESSGKTKEEAMAGPFKEVARQPLTELIKYQRGRWTY